MAKKSGKTTVIKDPIVDEDGILCLKGDLFWKWRALDSELRAATSELTQVKSDISIEIAKHSALAEMISRQAGLIGQVSVAKGELLNVQAEIEKKLSVKLTDCAFDDKTGRLYNLAEDGSRGAPVKPKARRARKTT